MKAIRQNTIFDNKLFDKDALKVVNVINNAGYEAYFVGGCIRDLLLGLEPKDFDVATNAKPEQVRKLFKRSRIIGRRFRLVHVLFKQSKFIEVATFRSGQAQTKDSGVVVRDNAYGTMSDDVVRRDFKINTLYYDVNKEQIIDYVGGLDDIKTKSINILGDVQLRFAQDPVRILRAIRFKVKLGAKLNKDIDSAIYEQAQLLANVSPVRLYNESIKLLHNSNCVEMYFELKKFGVLNFLFSQAVDSDFINKALIDTENRIKNKKSVSPVFLFAVLLWQARNDRFKLYSRKQKSSYLAMQSAEADVISTQIKQVSMPRWLSAKVLQVWELQLELEKNYNKKPNKLLQSIGFRMAYDFLLLRAKSINPELSEVAKFWTKAQL